MISYIRKHISAVNIIAVIALVFALTGGAWAARKYIITSTSQIKPSVLKALQGKAGPKGPQGPQGLPGPAGSAGPAGVGKEGPAGKNGTNGTNGSNGLNGATGPAGPTGPEGVCAKAPCTLPSGATETGMWSMSVINAPRTLESFTPISFPIPLAAGSSSGAILTAEETEEIEEGLKAEGKDHCAGTLTAPTAPKGTLCVYTKKEAPSGALNAKLFLTTPAGPEGYSSAGTFIRVKLLTGEEAVAVGAWAVTAP